MGMAMGMGMGMEMAMGMAMGMGMGWRWGGEGDGDGDGDTNFIQGLCLRSALVIGIETESLRVRQTKRSHSLAESIQIRIQWKTGCHTNVSVLKYESCCFTHTHTGSDKCNP